jgi:hypothetical protein
MRIKSAPIGSVILILAIAGQDEHPTPQRRRPHLAGKTAVALPPLLA